MSAPAKPWELGGTNRFEGVPTLSSSSEPVYNPSNVFGGSVVPVVVRPTRTAPPLPARHRSIRHVGSGYAPSPFGNFGTGFSNYGGLGSSYGGYGGYGNYGGYGSYGGFGAYGGGFARTNNPESRFIQMAEEGSRPAFQSIESIVQAFCSVSFMMESTFNAMYSSFRAVLGVAENFGQLRTMFGQFLSIFAIFRWLRWLFKKCMYKMGVSAANPDLETWFTHAEAGADGVKKPALSWPVIFFLGIVFSGPYLMWKLLNSLNIPSIDPYNVNDWRKCKTHMYSAVALYDFTASSEQELGFVAGQRLLIAPKELQPRTLHSWLIAAKGKKVGLIPANYVQILGRVPSTSNKPQQPHQEQDNIAAQQPAFSQEQNNIPTQQPHQERGTYPIQQPAFSQEQNNIPTQQPHQEHGTYPIQQPAFSTQMSDVRYPVQNVIPMMSQPGVVPQQSINPYQLQNTLPVVYQQPSTIPYQLQNIIPAQQPVLPQRETPSVVSGQVENVVAGQTISSQPEMPSVVSSGVEDVVAGQTMLSVVPGPVENALKASPPGELDNTVPDLQPVLSPGGDVTPPEAADDKSDKSV